MQLLIWQTNQGAQCAYARTEASPTILRSGWAGQTIAAAQADEERPGSAEQNGG